MNQQSSSTQQYPFYWILTATTLIQPINELETPTISPYLHLDSISNLHVYAYTDRYKYSNISSIFSVQYYCLYLHYTINKKITLDIFGAVIHALPLRKVRIHRQTVLARDYIIINQEYIIIHYKNSYSLLKLQQSSTNHKIFSFSEEGHCS